MAIGLLGAATATFGNPAVTVYTVPNGISHAVVHITGAMGNLNNPMNLFAYLKVNSNVVLSLEFISVSAAVEAMGASRSVSVMLNPGDVVSVVCTGTGTANTGATTSCTVSGYEVPL